MEAKDAKTEDFSARERKVYGDILLEIKEMLIDGR
jgi:hypothetical protein